jgi:hypothetical protein
MARTPREFERIGGGLRITPMLTGGIAVQAHAITALLGRPDGHARHIAQRTG